MVATIIAILALIFSLLPLDANAKTASTTPSEIPAALTPNSSTTVETSVASVGETSAVSVGETAADSILFHIPAPAQSPTAKVDKNYDLGHFTWGADVGSAIDLTANDMSSIDIHGYFGYKGLWTRLLGIGVGINSMINNSSRCYPVYAIYRTSFTELPQLCFMDLRLGLSFNNILHYPSQTNFYGSIGVGITLAKGRKFSSHIILSYNLMPIHKIRITTEIPDEGRPGEVFEGEETPPTYTETTIDFPNLSYGAIRIGCSF